MNVIQWIRFHNYINKFYTNYKCILNNLRNFSGYVVDKNTCTIKEAEKVIQEWLRHAGDRIKYQLKKI